MSTPLDAKACSVKRAIPGKPVPISVNGVALSRAAIAQEMQHHPASKPIDAWYDAARALVIRELLLQEARRLHVTATPLCDEGGRRETDEEALMRALLVQEVQTPQADEAACRRYYKQNQKRFVTPDLFSVSHILIPASDDEGATGAAQTKASAILATLRERPDAFAALAREHSACPSREVGGNLGQIGPGQTVPEFEAALASAPLGEVAPEAVRTRYGLHIIHVEHREPGRQVPFDMVQDKIAAFLNERVRQIAERQYVELLAGQANIEGIQIEANASPLIQ